MRRRTTIAILVGLTWGLMVGLSLLGAFAEEAPSTDFKHLYLHEQEGRIRAEAQRDRARWALKCLAAKKTLSAPSQLRNVTDAWSLSIDTGGHDVPMRVRVTR